MLLQVLPCSSRMMFSSDLKFDDWVSVDLFFHFSFHSSMDVQGDYDPCDASGFIRINAVRLEPFADKMCLDKRVNISVLYIFTYSTHLLFFSPSCSSPQVEGTPSPAGFLQHQKVTVAALQTFYFLYALFFPLCLKQ